ncbi:NADPH-dependent FMN reductase [Paenibacillus sp. FSL H8-0261]|uniref:NADPH-dependent FMN reductase n=1 Tax=Paenibacillus sp. FSL H8-0261 TaxID=2921381 RepID=UPI00324AFEE8
MKIIGISGSIVGSKTRIAVQQALNNITEKHPDFDVELIDLGDYKLEFSDGRSYMDYTGDTKVVLKKIMAADAYIIGTPVFQASIPGTLKNLFDLLPVNGFKDKVIGIVVTAGSSKHYLVAEQQLKPILSYMRAVVVPKYVFIEEKQYDRKVIVDDEIIFRLNRLANELVNTTNAMQQVKQAEEAAFFF